MSILKEPKSLDDRNIKEDTPYEKWEDRFATDKYRTFATHVPMFDFTTKTSPTLQWKVDDFSKWFKNPAGLPVASNETVPYTHYKLGSNEAAKEDKDVFGNNIINNQKDFRADHMNRTLPEKYAYGLDRKGQGDLAYEQLDIEHGDENELSRARDEFLEQMYLKEEEPQMMSALKAAKNVINESKTKLISDNNEIERAKRMKSEIEVEAIPQLLGKTKDPKIPMEEIGRVYSNLKSIRDKPLSQRDINGVNRLLMRLDGKRIPIGTYAYAAADKLEEAFKKLNPNADWSFASEYRQMNNDMAGKIQRNVRRHAAQKQADNAKREKHERTVNFMNDAGYDSAFDKSPLPGNRRNKKTPLRRSSSSSDISVGSNASAKNDINEEPFGVTPRSVKNTPKRKERRQSRQFFASPRAGEAIPPPPNAGGGGARSQLHLPIVAEAKVSTPAKPRTKAFTSPAPAETKSRPPSPIMPLREEIAAAGGGGAKEEKKDEAKAAAAAAVGKNPDYVVGDTEQIRKFNQAIDLITTTYEMSLSTARADGAIYSITPQFRQEISKLLGTHNFNANTKNIKQIADWMKRNKPRPTDIGTRSTTSPRASPRPASSRSRSKASESRPPSSSGVTETWEL